MGLKFNPFSGNFDFTGSGSGGAQYIDGEVATYADLPLDGSAALNTAWLVRTASGVWPVTRKQAGIYIRTATGGSNRDSDYTYAGTMPDVFSDAQFLIYDDANTARTMSVEVTDNETLTFKVRGTDSIVRSVALALSAIVLAFLMASSAFAQNVGLVSDTNGNIVTRRTNVLSFTNNVRFTLLTNGDSRTAIIGTNGALAAGNPPSGAAANGALLTADGAGSSSFVVSRTQTVAMTNSAFRTNTTDSSTTNAQTNMVLNLDASSTYHFAFAFIITSATTGGFNARLLHSNTTNGLRSTYVGRMGRPINIAASDITASSAGAISLQAVNFAGTNIVVTGTGILSTGTSSGTLTFIWYQNTATNVATELVAGSMITITKINP